MVESSFRRLYTWDIWLNFFFLNGLFWVSWKEEYKNQHEPWLLWENLLITHTPKRGKEDIHSFHRFPGTGIPAAPSRGALWCFFQSGLRELWPPGAPLAFPHQWHFASLKGPQPPWSQTVPGCSAWQSFPKPLHKPYTLPLRHTQQTPKCSRHYLKATAVSSP